MSDKCETLPAEFETGATIPEMTPEQRAEIERRFKVLDSTRQRPRIYVVTDDVPLVSVRLIETARACETLSAWTGWRLPPAQQALQPALIAAHGLFERHELVAVIMTGKPRQPRVIEKDLDAGPDLDGPTTLRVAT